MNLFIACSSSMIIVVVEVNVARRVELENFWKFILLFLESF